MISFLKSFGAVIVSSNLRETKGYSPGFFFLRSEKKDCVHEYNYYYNLGGVFEGALYFTIH